MKRTDRFIKKRVRRVVLCALMPVFLFALGSALRGLGIAGVSQAGLLELLGNLFSVLLFGYLLMGIQSVIYALLMEYWVHPSVSNHLWAIFLSGWLGLLSGLSLLMLFSAVNGGFTWVLIVGGLGVGLIVGGLSRWHFVENTVLVQTDEYR